ncbi:unnamed protein product [Diamesa serratosioi]
MEEDDNKQQLLDANKTSELEATESNDNFSNVYHDLSSLRQQHQQQFQQASILQTLANSSTKAAGVRKTFEQFSTTSSSSLVSAISGTTGGNNTIVTGDDIKTMMDNNACAGTGTTMFATQQSITSSSTSLASSTMSMNTATATATKKNKTLSFLHNEDLFASDDSVASSMPGGMSSGMQRDDKIVPASHLFRSISFQERRQQQTLQSCLKRTESGKEGKSDLTRKVSILSPKNSLHDVNDRIKQQQMKMQQQLQQFASYSSSSDMSM